MKRAHLRHTALLLALAGSAALPVEAGDLGLAGALGDVSIGLGSDAGSRGGGAQGGTASGTGVGGVSVGGIATGALDVGLSTSGGVLGDQSAGVSSGGVGLGGLGTGAVATGGIGGTGIGESRSSPLALTASFAATSTRTRPSSSSC